MATVTAIVNQKGGVGKTTTTLNMAAGMAAKGQRVLAIDVDPQSSLTLSLGIEHPDDLEHTLASAMEAMIQGEETWAVEETIVHTDEGIDLLPANIDLATIELSLVNAMSRENILKEVISLVKDQYDYVLLDCPPTLGLLTVNALTAADKVVIPTQANFLSVRGLDQLFRSIALVRRRTNSHLQIDGILLTMTDRTKDCKEVGSSLRETMGNKVKVYNTEIPKSVRAPESTRCGKSIFEHDRHSTVAKAYKDLVEEVLNCG